MKKEIVFLITLGLFLLAYILDYFSGVLRINLQNPIAFLDKKFITLYPMTLVSIISRSIALMLSVWLILSLFEKKYLAKLGISLFLFFIGEVYSFQQLATGTKFSSLQWTLSISYGGALLIVPAIVYIIAGISNFLIPQNDNKKIEDNSSVLNPSKN